MSDVTARLTDRTRDVLRLASHEAASLRHAVVAPEHVLLGIVREQASPTAKLLHAQGARVDRLRATLLLLVAGHAGTRQQDGPTGEMTVSSDTRAVLQRAQAAADERQHAFISVEHLFIGLVADEGVAARALKACGVDPDRVWEEVVSLLDRAVPPARPDGAPQAEPVQVGGIDAGPIAFSRCLARALQAAILVASQRAHRFVQAEDVFVALLGDPNARAGRALRALGLPLAEAAEHLRRDSTHGQEPGRHPPGLSTEARQAITRAIDEARRRGELRVDTGQVLTALLETNAALQATLVRVFKLERAAVQAAVERQRARAEP